MTLDHPSHSWWIYDLETLKLSRTNHFLEFIPADLSEWQQKPTKSRMWILNSPSLALIKVLFTLLKCSITTETFHVERCAAEPLNTPAAFTLPFLCSAQRPKPQGGAAVWEWQRGSHSESPELFHFKSTHQSLLPGRGCSPGEAGQCRRKESALMVRVNWGCARATKQTILQQEVIIGLQEVATFSSSDFRGGLILCLH